MLCHTLYQNVIFYACKKQNKSQEKSIKKFTFENTADYQGFRFPVSLFRPLYFVFGQAFGLATQGLVAPSGLLHPGLYIFRPYGPLPGLPAWLSTNPWFSPTLAFQDVALPYNRWNLMLFVDRCCDAAEELGYTSFGPMGLIELVYTQKWL